LQTSTRGKLDTAGMADFVDAAATVRQAAADLGLSPEKEVRRMDRTVGDLILLVAEDRGGGAVKVRLDRWAASLFRSRIDVGLFGDEATARLFLSRMREQKNGVTVL